MRRVLVLVAMAACGQPTDHKLPGASLTPQLSARPAPPACEVDVSDGSTLFARYAYNYDAAGRLAHIVGTFTGSSMTETIDYSYDNLGHMTHELDTGGYAHVEITANYDTLGDLIDYTDVETSQSDNENNHYVMSDFTDGGQPRVQTVTVLGAPKPVRFAIDYDESGRVARVVGDDGEMTTYTYDDADSRTLTIDTNNGAYHEVIVYDGDQNELSDDVTGTDSSVTPSESLYDYTGERLQRVTFKRGAPLATVEVDTLKYDCSR